MTWYKSAKNKITNKELNDKLKSFIKDSNFFNILFKRYNIPIDRIDDNLEFKLEELPGKNAISDSSTITFNEKLFNDNFFEDGIHYVVHEVSHWLQRQREKNMYFADPEEIEAFVNGIIYEILRNKSLTDISRVYYPIISKHFPNEKDSVRFYMSLLKDANDKIKYFS